MSALVASATSTPTTSTPINTKPQIKDEVKVKVCPGHTRPVCHINYSNIINDDIVPNNNNNNNSSNNKEKENNNNNNNNNQGTFWFVTSCHDSKPMLRNGQTGDWVGTFEGHKGAVYCSSFNKTATKLITGSGDYTAAIWDTISGNKLHSWEHPHYIKSCDWIENKIITGSYDSNFRIFDAEQYSSEPVVIKHLADSNNNNNNNNQSIKATYFIDDVNNCVTASDSIIIKWDLRQKSPTTKVELPGLNVLEYTHINDIVAAHGKSITFFDPKTLIKKSGFTAQEDIECGSLSPCGKKLAIGSKIKAKEYTITGEEIESHRGHHGPVFHIRWAPDGKSFTSGAEDGMCRIWPSHEIITLYEGN